MGQAGKLAAMVALSAALALVVTGDAQADPSAALGDLVSVSLRRADVPDSESAGAAGARICATLSEEQTRIRFHGKTYDLREMGALRELAGVLDAKLQDEPARTTGSPHPHSGARDSQDGDGATDPPPGAHPSPADSDAPSSDHKDGAKHGGDRDALAAMRALVSRVSTAEPPPCDALVTIAEIGDSLQLESQRPVPAKVDLVQVPSYYLNLLHASVGKGTTPAYPLAPANPRQGSAASDPSLRDPAPSSFWSRPKDIAALDLYHQFGPILETGREPCLYDEPKTSYGTTPGFSILCGGKGIKVKFGAVKLGGRSPQAKDSEPTATRLFGALGYHVEPNDYAPEIRLRYDRRILLEFNSRKDLSLTITALGFIPVYRLKVQGVVDPFSYVRSAVLKNGAVLTPESLAIRLLTADVLARSARAARKSPRGTRAEHYRPDAAAFEESIDYLVMEGANIQARDSGGENIGPWAWDRLDHERRRELRGAGLLAAWMNYYDARWDNNRLKLADSGQGGSEPPGVIHSISDLGSVLGRAESFRVAEGNLVNEFPWTCTEPPAKDRRGREKKPFRVVGYKPVMPNGAFREMTVEDARWMARLIAQLTEDQIVEALLASGFGSAEIKVYTEKLLSRRDRMIEDLGLSGEIAPLRPGGSLRAFDYDPRRDGPVRATLPDGSVVTAVTTSGDQVVRGGRVEPR
jgi:hypothetical protein